MAIKKPRVNREITAAEVRLIDAEGLQLGIVTAREALDKAKEVGLDLVEVSPQTEASLPVCRIMDYGKHRFDTKKRYTQKKRAKQQVKEVKIRVNTDIADYNVKVRKMGEFLGDGDKVKVSLRFRGRELAHQDLGLALLKRVADSLVEVGIVEQFPKFEGKQLLMIIAPKGVPKV